MGDQRSPPRKAGAARRPAAGPVQRTVQPAAAARLQQRIGLRGTQALLARAPHVQRSAPADVVAGAGMRVSAPSDPAEREAEATARQVMRAPAQGGGTPTDGGGCCQRCDAGSATRQVMRAPAPDASESPSAHPPLAAQMASDAGAPLPPQVRGFMEPRFNAGFGHVRVHTGQPAAEMSRRLQARAFTVGHDIFFDKGQFRPDTDEGRELIAHELTHTIQQGGTVQRRATPDAREPDASPDAARLPVQAAQGVHVQRAWYNVDIPFTDYQFDPSIEGVKTAASYVKDKAEAGFDWVVDQVKGLVDAAREALSALWESIRNEVEAAFDGIRKTFTDIVGFITNPLGTLGDALMNMDGAALARGWARFSALVTTVANGFKAAAGALLGTVDKLWKRIDGLARSWLDRISRVTAGWLFKKLPDVLQRIAHKAIDGLNSLRKSINDGWNKLFNKVKTWVDGAIDTVFGFVRRVLSFAINGVIAGIVQFGKLVLFLKDFFSNPKKYIDQMAKGAVQAFSGVEGRFGGMVGQYFGARQTMQAAPAAATPKGTAPVRTGGGAARSAATWGEIGHGVSTMMGKKWAEFKSNPMAVITTLLLDLCLPFVGNVKDVIQLFKDIKRIVTGPLSAGSLEELWTSLLEILDIPILIYHTVVSILMRTLMLPLIVASFIPHPVVKAVAAAVGYGLLAAFVQAEMLNLTHKLVLLKTGSTTGAQKEEAYNRIADSLIALAMTAVIMVIMLILHFLANVAKGIYNFIKGKVFGIEAKPVDVKGGSPAEGAKEGQPAEHEGAGGEPGKEVSPSQDGKRKLRINEEGKCEVCASPCKELREKYASVMTKEFEAKIKAIEEDASLSDVAKDEKLKPLEQELSDLLQGKEAAAPKTTTVTKTVGKNKVTYTVDANGNTISAKGTLVEDFGGGTRSPAEKNAQANAGAKGLPTDHGGHLVGYRFFPEQGSLNMYPQDANFNLSGFKTIENDYARFIKAGNRVEFEHVLGNFDPATGRPGTLKVKFEVIDPNGKVIDSFAKDFNNTSQQSYVRRKQ